MKKSFSLVFAAIIFVAGFSIESFAQRIYQPKKRSIDSRQYRQQTRINRGINSGRLTRSETYRLQRRQANIHRVESRYRRSGGRFTYAERRNVQRRLNRTNRAIYRQKHDRQNRRVVSAMPVPRRRL